MKENFILLTTLFVVGTFLAGCSSDDKTPADPTLSLAPATGTISFGWQATESYTFEVKTNQVSWTAEPDQDWCIVTPDYENDKFVVTALENDSQTPLPDAVITVKAGDATPVKVTATMGAVSYSVYVIGEFSRPDAVYSDYCYWKDGIFNEFDSLGYNKRIYNTTISDGSIYMLGSYIPTNIHGGARVLCYWKDGVRTDLDIPEIYHFYNWSIGVSNGSVHIIANYNDDESRPFYWQNGVITSLGFPETSNHRELNSIVASGGSVYIGGSYEKEDFGRVACYWKDGLRTDLEFDETVGHNICLAVENGSVYLSGGYNVPPDKSVAFWWKDGDRTACQAPEGNNWTSPCAIAVDEGTVHILGESDWNRTYWKNGVMTVLDTDNYWYTESLAAGGGSAYLVGERYDEDTETTRAFYWKDGVITDLETPEGMHSYGTFILVEKI